RGETLELRLHPDVRPESWQAGGFHLLRSASENGWQVLTLLGGGVEAETPLQRPHARLQSQTAEFLARQLAWWQVGPEHSALTVQIAYAATRGQMFQLPVLLPKGWDVDGVELTPADSLRNWSSRAREDGSLLLVDLKRPLLA